MAGVEWFVTYHSNFATAPYLPVQHVRKRPHKRFAQKEVALFSFPPSAQIQLYGKQNAVAHQSVFGSLNLSPGFLGNVKVSVAFAEGVLLSICSGSFPDKKLCIRSV